MRVLLLILSSLYDVLYAILYDSFDSFDSFIINILILFYLKDVIDRYVCLF